MHHYQQFAVPVVLTAMVFAFQFIETGMAEMLVWLPVIVSKSVFYNLIDHLVIWFVIAYN